MGRGRRAFRGVWRRCRVAWVVPGVWMLGRMSGAVPGAAMVERTGSWERPWPFPRRCRGYGSVQLAVVGGHVRPTLAAGVRGHGFGQVHRAVAAAGAAEGDGDVAARQIGRAHV